ncbi:hypothetical protein V6N13_114436 [Hibiscus sabdariffa]
MIKLIECLQLQSESRHIHYSSHTVKMNKERLMKMAGAVQTGGKGSMRSNTCMGIHTKDSENSRRLIF